MTENSIDAVGETWEELAQIDPLWAILSEPDKLGRQWKLDEFLATGEEEIGLLLEELRRLGLDRFGAALDFGCGVGRLSLPLSRRFERVTGVDIAPTMIAKARELAGPGSNITYVVNGQPDLSFVPTASLDLVYSNIVLQHMPSSIAALYIREFFRVIRPGGFVVFQIPSHLTEEWLPGGNEGTQLEEGSHRMEVEILDLPEAVVAGEPFVVDVRVRNTSELTWTQDLRNQLNVGNHWLRPDGTEVEWNDGRARLAGRIRPGEADEVRVTCHAPLEAGAHVLEIDVVQEGVTWFSSRGAETVRRTITVHPSAVEIAPVEAPPDERAYPTFMMNGIPRDEVEALVDAGGADVLTVVPHVTEWVSYRYVTRRRT